MQRNFTEEELLELIESYKIQDVNKVKVNLNTQLGEGSYSDVYKGYIENAHQVFAVKCLTPANYRKYCEQGILEETRVMVILKETNAPNVVYLHEYGVIEGDYTLWMEFIDKGTLEEKLDVINLTQKKTTVLGVARALEHLHQYKITHNDIKPANIMLTKDWVPKLCDFGLSVQMRGFKQGLEYGTPLFLAPEILAAKLKRLRGESRKKYPNDEKTDIHSYGLTMWCTMKRKPYPYADMLTIKDPREAMQTFAVKVVERNEREDLPNKLESPPYITQLMKFCWDGDRDKRPSMSEVVECLEQEKMYVRK